jgi:fermentation-respiration switch protein FrsA (DUF1100 family)
MIYFPFSHVPEPSEVGLTRVDRVTFDTDDGLTLNGWFVPTSAANAEFTAIVFNGNAGNRAYRADLAAGFARAGVAALLFDYRGYGGNPGAPSEEGLALDARAAHRYVMSRGDVRRDRIAYFGESLGAAAAVRLALEQRPRALILRSPFTSLVDTGRYHYPLLPVRWLLKDRFPSIDRIAKVGCPLLVIAGADDRIVPAAQSRRLYEAAAEPKQLVILDGVDHNDFALVAGPRVIGAAVEFLRGLE